MPPIVSVIGRSKSGKTTLVEKLTMELGSRGYRIATVKHTPHGMNFDKPDKDTWRYLEAGSVAAVASSEDKMVLIRPVAPKTLDGIARILGEDCDLILAEGFKQGDAPKIEVHRREVGPLLSGIKKLVAVVTDEPVATKARQFGFADIKALADLLETGFIKPQRERLSVYVNDTPLSLSTFPREFVTNVLLAMASSLKGVGKVRSLGIFLRRDRK
jgi:molybdopterin-guanine dinucleotide biosynthesis protein B